MATNGLYCQHCGELNDIQAQFCRKCGAAQPQAQPISTSAEPGWAPQPPYPLVPPVGGQMPPGYPPAPPAAAAEFRGYAGFWIRFLAIIIDGAILGAVMIPLWLVLMGILAATGLSVPEPGAPPDPRFVFTLLPVIGLFVLGSMAARWLYEALMTSSSKQATLGKMALRLKVTDKDGQRLSFLHATGRHFAKMINGLTFNIGYIIAGFTDRKQGLHDMIAGTYVIKV